MGQYCPAPRLYWQWLVIVILVVNVANFKWNLFTPGKFRFIHEYTAIKHCLAMIPPKASLAAQSALIPHMPKRRVIFMLPETGEAEYILLHLQFNPWPMETAQLRELDARLQHSAEYSCQCSSGYLHLYRKNSAKIMPAKGNKR
jgi:hypothetical protein